VKAVAVCLCIKSKIDLCALKSCIIFAAIFIGLRKGFCFPANVFFLVQSSNISTEKLVSINITNFGKYLG